MKKRNEILAASLLACEESEDGSPDAWGAYKYLGNRLVHLAVMSKYRRYRLSKRRESGDSDVSWRCEIVSEKLSHISEFDGSWMEGFLEFLIEHGPEIIELIMKIVALFGEEEATPWEPSNFDEEMVDVLVACSDHTLTSDEIKRLCHNLSERYGD